MQVLEAAATDHPGPMPENVFAPAVKIARWLRGRFRCQHWEMSRPFTRDGETYRACLSCGARRPFNLKAWKTKGGFYYGAISTELLPVESKVRKQSLQPTRVKTAA